MDVKKGWNKHLFKYLLLSRCYTVVLISLLKYFLWFLENVNESEGSILHFTQVWPNSNCYFFPSESSIEHLDISYNLLHCVGVELLLKCLNCSRITSLNLSATLSDSRSSAQVYRHLYNYASQVFSLFVCVCLFICKDCISIWLYFNK